MLAQTANIRRMTAQTLTHPGLRLQQRPAMRKDGPQARITQCRDRSIRMRRRILHLRPIQHRRDAGIDGAKRAEQVADVHILGTIARAQSKEDFLEVLGCGSVDVAMADTGLKCVPVTVHESRQHDHLFGADHLCVMHLEVRLYSRNPAILDEHIGLPMLAN